MFNATTRISTYAFFDVIGVKRALLGDRGLDLLNAAWKAADVWAMTSSDIHVKIEGRHATTTADVRVTTIADSIFLSTPIQYTLDSFYNLALSLRVKLVNAGVDCYCIINRDEEVSPHTFPALGCTQGNYYSVTGAGPAWANIYLADEALRGKLKSWRNGHRLYAVGETLVDAYPPLASAAFTGLGGKQAQIHALDVVPRASS